VGVVIRYDLGVQWSSMKRELWSGYFRSALVKHKVGRGVKYAARVQWSNMKRELWSGAECELLSDMVWKLWSGMKYLW